MRKQGFTIIELLVAMAIFGLVSVVCVMLMRAEMNVFVWGDKRMQVLRQNREITKRLAPIIRGASAPSNADPVDRPNTTLGPIADPVPANHVEQLVFRTTREYQADILQSTTAYQATYNSLKYPMAGSFVPPGRPDAPANLDDMYGWVRVFWQQSDASLRADANTPGDETDDVFLVRGIPADRLADPPEATAQFRRLQAVDFDIDDLDRAVRVAITTRSTSQNTRMEDATFTTNLRVQLVNWH